MKTNTTKHTYRCAGCGLDTVGKNTAGLCPDCYSDEYTICDRCGDDTHRYDLTEVPSYGTWICPRCLSENYTVAVLACNYCGHQERGDKLTTVADGDRVCRRCFRLYFAWKEEAK